MLVVVIQLCASETISTQKTALQLLALLVSAESLSLSPVAAIEEAAKALEIPNGWDILTVKGLQSDDMDCAKFALEGEPCRANQFASNRFVSAINAIAEREAVPEVLLEMLDEQCGLLDAVVKRCLPSNHFREPLIRQQRIRIAHVEKDRGTQYEGSKPEHVGLLKEMWGFVLPDVPYPGDKGEHWDRLGFQGKVRRAVFFFGAALDRFRSRIQRLICAGPD